MLFSPHRMQVADPAPPLQESCLLAAAAAGPAVMVAELKSAVEYANCHSTEAGSAPAAFKVRFKVTELPAAATPEEIPSDTPWAGHSDAADRRTKTVAAYRHVYRTDLIRVLVLDADWLQAKSTDTFAKVKSVPPLSRASEIAD